MESNFFSIWEVETQSKVKSVVINDGEYSYGYEPQCMLALKSPKGSFAFDSIEAKLTGKAALYPFKKGDLVAVKLHFWRKKVNHEYVNCVIINDIKLVKDLENEVRL